ncbi:two-component system sensor histidine kinase DesK [Kibdelosporangium banguiense]|uniref:Two-component system sensor histidine kinase DesK n=1 Tax=Kibdelosporangium banguiense TaxID=1365924 RepID=A0ABS4TDF4_9PSEU|nr:histidine kinase [Kibdelosporangium banguiense]MBP2322454.1 two-component system sensor histidine kinase DesK [Kibdelosporangium banguiense]
MSEAALESLRRSTRNTLLFTDLMVGLLPLGFLVQADPVPDVSRMVILLVGAVGFVFVHARGVYQAINSEWRPFPLRRVYALCGLAIALACFATSIDTGRGALSALLVSMAVSEFFIARPIGVAWRHIGAVLAMYLAASSLVAVLSGHAEEVGSTALLVPLLVLLTAYGIGVTYRQWEGALKLEEARRAAAELATTRERLRLAEDLHDILGHALEVVSLKSELAARLDDPVKSRNEMVEVQRLARNALRDVRALAHGNRPTDLATELVGARKLLESAGIACDVDADLSTLTGSERELFGRVLRESVTNALRHADPRKCTVTLTVRPGQVVLRVVNDGTVPIEREGEGTGLAGLARRITAADGEFTAQVVEPASFEVIASLPR